MKKDIKTLKTYFETGDKPTEQQFSDLIDSYHHIDSGQVVTDVTEDQDGNKTIVLSDNTAIPLASTVPNVDQNNTIRTIDLEIIRVNDISSYDAISQAVVKKFNSLSIADRTVSETENIVITTDVRFLK